MFSRIGRKLNEMLSTTSVESEHSEDTGISRRALLGGIGMAGAFAVAGASLALPGEAHAQTIEAQYRRDRRRGPPPRRRRQRRGRHRGRGRGRGQRYGRRDLQRRCRGDRGFRARNRNLCARATGMRRGRPGACVQIGPVQICD